MSFGENFTYEYYVALIKRNCEPDANGMPFPGMTDYDRRTMEIMLLFNPDPFLPIFRDLFSNIGRPAKHQMQLMRLVVLWARMRNRTVAKNSIGAFIEDVLPYNKFLYTMIGCASPEEIPSESSYHDFCNRLYQGDTDRYCPDCFYCNTKNSNKNKFRIGNDNKIVDSEFHVEDIVADCKAGIRRSGNSEMYLQQMLGILCVIPSMRYGVIPPNTIASCDATILYSEGNRFGTCECGKERMNCSYRDVCGAAARFSAPDASVGYDSGERCNCYGYHLHLLTSHSRKYGVDLPINFMLADTERHDSVVFPVLLQETFRNLPFLKISYLLGDSAFDVPAIYDFLLGFGITPIIDINSKTMTYPGLPKDIHMNKSAKPVCLAGKEMELVRNNEENQTMEYRCPLTGKECGCPHSEKCGRLKEGADNLVIDPKDSPRFFGPVARDSEEFWDLYKNRTASERLNNRLLNDMALQSTRTRYVSCLNVEVAGSCMLAHLEAWVKVGILPDYGPAKRLYQSLQKKGGYFLKKGEKLVVPSPPKCREMTQEEKDTVEKLRTRNAQERREEAEFQKRKLEHTIKIKCAMASQAGNWPAGCPVKAAQYWDLNGINPLLNPPLMNIPIEDLPKRIWEERGSVKKWETTTYPYLAPLVVIDPDGRFMPLEQEEETGGEDGKKKTKQKKKPREVNGFVEIRRGVWMYMLPHSPTPNKKETPTVVEPEGWIFYSPTFKLPKTELGPGPLKRPGETAPTPLAVQAQEQVQQEKVTEMSTRWCRMPSPLKTVRNNRTVLRWFYAPTTNQKESGGKSAHMFG